MWGYLLFDIVTLFNYLVLFSNSIWLIDYVMKNLLHCPVMRHHQHIIKWLLRDGENIYHITGHTVYDRPHMMWQDTFYITGHILYNRPHIIWQDTYYMTGHILYIRTHIIWQATYYMTGHTLYDRTFLNVMCK